MSGCLVWEVDVEGIAAGGVIGFEGVKFWGKEPRREESERRKAMVTVSYTSNEN